MKIKELNKVAWNHAVDAGDNPYTQVVSSEQIADAKQGNWSVNLTDLKPVPKTWFPELTNCDVLCLASGGGQQAPIFSALGSNVTLLDVSSKQLEQDQFVATRDDLDIRLVEGDMADLSAFESESFDLVFNPVSTLFIPDLQPVWRECYRVTRFGGRLMTGFMNPDEFVFDDEALDSEGQFVVKHPLPYIEYDTLDRNAFENRIQEKEMFHFSHSMETQLGGLLEAGFVITGFYEDRRTEEDGNPIRHFLPSYFAVLAMKVR